MPPAKQNAPKKRTLPAPSVSPRIRNKGIVKVLVADLVANAANYRTHSDAQHKALAGTVDAIGWYGAPDVRQLPDGRYELIDGHMRRQWLLDTYGETAEIEVNVTDLSEEEARIALATKDPLAAMANQDADKMAALIDSIRESEGSAFDSVITTLADMHAEFDGFDGFDGPGPTTPAPERTMLPPPVGVDAGSTVDPENIADEWRDMPEYENDDETPTQTIHMHFADYDAAKAFGELIGQSVTPKTKTLWYPAAVQRSHVDKRYAAENGLE